MTVDNTSNLYRAESVLGNELDLKSVVFSYRYGDKIFTPDIGQPPLYNANTNVAQDAFFIVVPALANKFYHSVWVSVSAKTANASLEFYLGEYLFWKPTIVSVVTSHTIGLPQTGLIIPVNTELRVKNVTAGAVSLSSIAIGSYIDI